jgi:hypothetical protein
MRGVGTYTASSRLCDSAAYSLVGTKLAPTLVLKNCLLGSKARLPILDCQNAPGAVLSISHEKALSTFSVHRIESSEIIGYFWHKMAIFFKTNNFPSRIDSF